MKERLFESKLFSSNIILKKEFLYEQGDFKTELHVCLLYSFQLFFKVH